MIDNYVFTQGWLPFVTTAFYLDAEPYVADGLFVGHKLRFHFGNEYRHEQFPYVVVSGWIWAWRQAEFEECICELYGWLGSHEYAEACQAFQAIVRAE